MAEGKQRLANNTRKRKLATEASGERLAPGPREEDAFDNIADLILHMPLRNAMLIFYEAALRDAHQQGCGAYRRRRRLTRASPNKQQSRKLARAQANRRATRSHGSRTVAVQRPYSSRTVAVQ